MMARQQPTGYKGSARFINQLSPPPVLERERFAARVQHAFKEVRYQHTLLADSGMELLRLAAQGLPRHAGRLLRLAVPKGLNPLPNELLQQAIEALR